MKNQAIVILKPQTAKSQAATIYIEDLFDDYKINIVERRPIRGEDLECFGIIDSHYGDTATNAMAKKLSDVKMPASKLELLVKMLRKQILEYSKTNQVAAKKYQEMYDWLIG